ncbi:hypothetical protein CTAYLR_002144 [Chrysophaeum taylorii]|uniref:Amino acid transporter transmembrane domain-containing protein n=1 Tax=Chrysophaeum taylorii TaxID=2483200 RepID=A0AAD7UN54_9STRA|nr:hypothetical protein CTAYLR_002144 [Chrysophaeum taylorii]
MGFTLVALAAWNEWCGLRLLACRELLSKRDREQLRSTESPLAALSRVAAGPASATVVDVAFVFLVLGVVTSYMIACHDMLAPTLAPVFPGLVAARRDIFAAAALCLPLTMVRDIGRLAPASVVGLACLAVSCVAVVAFAWTTGRDDGPGTILWSVSATPTDLASGFGVLSYCFGIVPLAPQFEASMRRPSDFKQAQRVSLAISCVVYAIVGVLVSTLYSRKGGGVSGNFLDNLPHTPIAAAVRVAMAVVCIFSAPFAVVAAAQVAHAKLGRSGVYDRLAVRTLILAIAASIAAACPSFALVISVVGSGAVSFLSFVLPPLLHWRFLGRRRQQQQVSPAATEFQSTLDLLAFGVGTVVVLFATSLTGASAYCQLLRPMGAKN